MPAAPATAVAPVRSGRSTTTRVLLLTPSLDYGGAEMVLVGLAQGLRSTGWDVCVVSMLEPRAFVTDLIAHGISVESLGMRPGAANVSGILRFLRLLRRIRPDLIHAHMYHANILARAVWPVMRIPVICTIQNILESSRKKNTARLRNWMYRITDWSCDQTTAVAETVRAHYVRRGLARSHRIRTIPNFIDTKRYYPDAISRTAIRKSLGWGEAVICLAVGRLELAKDYPTMLGAFAEISRQEPRARLIIAGKGRLRGELEADAARRGLSGVVQFLGNRTDIPELLRAADVYVMSSTWEGASVAVLEASASGLPVITTAAGGNAEMVMQGKTGYVVPCKDAPALSEAITTVLRSTPDERQAMGRAGRAFVHANYSEEIIYSKYEALYREVLGCPA